MVGKAAMIAVPLAPTASIARHDDHRTDADPVRWFNVAASSAQHRADERAHGRQRVASRGDLLIEEVPRMDHIRPYLQGHPHIRRARHAREPNGIVEQRLADPTWISMGGRPLSSA